MSSGYISNSLSEMLDKLKRNRHIDLKNTIEFGLEVYSLCSKENYEAGMAYALNCVGQANSDMSKYDKAIEYVFDSIKLSQKQGICDLQIESYIIIGNIYFDIEEYEKSLEYYTSAEKLATIVDGSSNYHEGSTYEFYSGKIYNNIGEIYRIIKCYEDALKYYRLSLGFSRKVNCEDKYDLGITLTNLGNIEYCFNKYDKALEYLDEAYMYLIDHKKKVGIIETCQLFALVYEKMGCYEECEKYFSEAMSFASEINYAYAKIQLHLDYSQFLENIGKQDRALEKLDEIYNISMDNKLYAKTMEICKRAIRLYEKVNDTYNANRYYKLYFQNEKKLEHIELEKRARSLKTKIKLNTLENENKTILEKSESFRRKAEELAKVIKNISIISELGEKVTTTSDLNKVYEMLYNTIRDFMKVSAFGVGLYNEKERKIQYPYLMENDEKYEQEDISMDNEISIGVKCIKTNKVIVMNDIENEYLNYIDDVNYLIDTKDSEEHTAAIFCPLAIDNNIIGVMTVQANEKDSFTMLNVEMIKALSSYAAIAINNAMKSRDLLAEVEERRKIQAKLEESNNRLIYLSENDGLTNIPNRRKFESFIEEKWNEAKKKQKPIALILFDIDFFKQYNDNFGHTEGDNCIVSISKILSKSLIKDYFAARYGGDEFVIVLPDADLDEAVKFAEIFRQSVKELALPHKFSKISDRITVTLGVSSVIPSLDIEVIDLIRQADIALYKSKNNGRNQVVGLRAE